MKALLLTILGMLVMGNKTEKMALEAIKGSLTTFAIPDEIRLLSPDDQEELRKLGLLVSLNDLRSKITRVGLKLYKLSLWAILVKQGWHSIDQPEERNGWCVDMYPPSNLSAINDWIKKKRDKKDKPADTDA